MLPGGKPLGFVFVSSSLRSRGVECSQGRETLDDFGENGDYSHASKDLRPWLQDFYQAPAW